MHDDLRFALRQFKAHPGFALATVVTLALGIGATTAVFTLADPMLFRPLPIPDADRVVRVRAFGGGDSRAAVRAATGTPFMIRLADYVRAEPTLQSMRAATFTMGATGRVGDQVVLGYGVSPRFFEVLAVQPHLGRLFAADEYRGREEPAEVAVVTHAVWQSVFGGRADVIGEMLRLEGSRPQSFQIVGVLPPTFFMPQTVNPQPGFLLPMLADASRASDPRFLAELIGRLVPGASIEAATAEMQGIISSTERELPAFPQGRAVTVTPLRDALFGPVRTPLLMLLGATGCVLLLACANLAHLFLSRLHARRRELGVRQAMGAGWVRLWRQLIVEAGLLAVAGGAAAIVVAGWTFDAIMAQTPDFVHVYRLLPADLDARVIAAAVLLVIGGAGIFSVIPAFVASRADLRASLQPTTTVTERAGRAEQWLVGAQAALAVALLVTGTLIVRSFVALAYQPLGWQPFGVTEIGLELPMDLVTGPGRERGIEAQRALYEALRQRYSTGVTVAAGVPAYTLPARADRPDSTEKVGRLVAYPVAGTFFDVFGVRLVRGRLFDDGEAFGNAAIAVVDARAAAALWPNDDPLGQSLRDSDGTVRTVVGLVTSVRTTLLDREAGAGSAFIPFGPRTSRMVPYLRTGSRPLSQDDVRNLAAPFLPNVGVTTRDFRLFEATLGQPRFLATLLSALSLLTIILTAVGVFAIVSHQASRRTREVGIRLALGASAARIGRLVLGGALVPAVLGSAAGLAAAMWWTPTLQALLFQIGPRDTATFAAATGFVLVLVVAASLAPTLRATRVDPVATLRAE